MDWETIKWIVGLTIFIIFILGAISGTHDMARREGKRMRGTERNVDELNRLARLEEARQAKRRRGRKDIPGGLSYEDE